MSSNYYHYISNFIDKSRKRFYSDWKISYFDFDFGYDFGYDYGYDYGFDFDFGFDYDFDNDFDFDEYFIYFSHLDIDSHADLFCWTS